MKHYEKYKPSGIEWLGEIPEDWEIKRVKDISAKVGDGLHGTPIYSDDSTYFFINGNNLQNRFIDLKNARAISQDVYNEIKISFNSQTLFLSINGTIGNLAFYNNEKIAIGKSVAYTTLKHSFNKSFLYYHMLTDTVLNSFEFELSGTTIKNLSLKTLRDTFLFVPQLKEQTTIANYLDTKTATIDRKIELLTAKADKYKALRRSLINETVCRGLPASEGFTPSETLTKMKDSGIEWIGKIPEHWEVKRVKEIFYIGRGRVIGQDELVDDGKYPVFSSQTENNGCLGYIDTFDFNTTLLTWTTDGANAGTLFKREGKFNCTNVCGTLKPKKRKENLDFILYVLQIAAKHNKRIDTNGAKIMNNEMSVIPLLYPPTEEQEAIAQYLNVKTTQIDTILTNISNQISKLTQLRKTLINDVVTGKIKVTD